MNRSQLVSLRTGLRITMLAAAVFAAADAPRAAAAPPLWKQLMPRKKVAADPNGDYTLGQENGPWLIMAASFTGETGEEQARDLVLEMRSRFNLPAYYYGMTFDLDGDDVGRGLTQYGGSIKRRLQRGDEVVQHAVLVGEFPAIDDIEAQDMLDQIKTMQPKALSVNATETSQTLAGVRSFYNQAKRRMGQDVPAGPMSHAFMTRNPLLPREYFVPNRVEPEVMEWNRQFEDSLLNCPGRYTIRVATFRGRIALDGAKGAPEISERVRSAKEDDPLVEAGEKAHAMVVALKEKEWPQVYEFHDRHESYVTIGSFDNARRLPNGQLVLEDRNAQIIMATFSATTPHNSLIKKPIPKNPLDEPLARQKFAQMFQGQGRPADGFNPKSIVGIPFDIIPQVMEVPRDSVSSTYARN